VRFSKGFIITMKENPKEAEAISHKLMLRASMVKQISAGIYTFLPLGLKVLNNITSIIRKELNSIGCTELLLPALLPADPWKETGRWDEYGKEMFRLKDRKERDMCLGPTHEEIITIVAKEAIKSYRDLPLFLYQIQTKYRDEPRPRFGIVRSKEFLMKDLYSFHTNLEDLKKGYGVVFESYKKIFKECSLSVITMEADPGTIGGSYSHEFIADADIGETNYILCQNCGHLDSIEGEDVLKDVMLCPKCKTDIKVKIGLEVGHTFMLGDKYSKVLNATFTDVDGTNKPFIMGCYGIGVSRIVSAIIEQHNDSKGILWPYKLAPYKINVIPVNMSDSKQVETAFKIYENLNKEGIETIIDDREESGGVKFKDSDLIGFPYSIICGRSIENDEVEIKNRIDDNNIKLSISSAVSKMVELSRKNI
jgi:prolyl-tRNA synthetase